MTLEVVVCTHVPLCTNVHHASELLFQDALASMDMYGKARMAHALPLKTALLQVPLFGTERKGKKKKKDYASPSTIVLNRKKKGKEKKKKTC